MCFCFPVHGLFFPVERAKVFFFPWRVFFIPCSTALAPALAQVFFFPWNQQKSFFPRGAGTSLFFHVDVKCVFVSPCTVFFSLWNRQEAFFPRAVFCISRAALLWRRPSPRFFFPRGAALAELYFCFPVAALAVRVHWHRAGCSFPVGCVFPIS